ncbi:uncharacterized protein LACBIDRAFT_300218 [Laccaria bicolor S238N-H82]|uniref:Predicted protein n=1 Tax=Laccaria bicolor (strain S238N-H82 / ATCC MYA-4686) TaxID=486041 RepID=B0E3V0_LACBS|nr:uncharacterized protein LACBIDRAFT_300218 [Laccaria bicolor S238N-H82]EDQ98483.1 predicted protein [Laccaria bicolor S238N-H82]|eukprot:XP_001890868.1 predicted protein [Laccaria bicolor S238N-H82]
MQSSKLHHHWCNIIVLPSFRSSLRSTRKQKLVSFPAVFVLSITTLQILNTDIGYANPTVPTCSRCRQTNAWTSRLSIALSPSCLYLASTQSSTDLSTSSFSTTILPYRIRKESSSSNARNYRQVILPIVRLGLIGPRSWVYRWKDLSVK